MQGGADKKQLSTENVAALEKGLPHLHHHIENVRQFGVPVVVAINRFVASWAVFRDYSPAAEGMSTGPNGEIVGLS